MEDYQDRITIATPEGVELRLVLAGLGSRFAAGLLDLLIKVVLIVGLQLAADVADLGVVTAILLAATFVVYIGFDVVFEVLNHGRTPGKLASGMRVLRADGGPVDLVSSLVRNILRLVDGAPLLYLPGLVSVLVTSRNQRLGDLAAGTIVVRERTAAHAVAFSAPVDAGVATVPGDIRRLGDEERGAVRAFLERRGGLEAPTRAEVARRLADGLRPHVVGAAAELEPESLLEWVAAQEERRGGGE